MFLYLSLLFLAVLLFKSVRFLGVFGQIGGVILTLTAPHPTL